MKTQRTAGTEDTTINTTDSALDEEHRPLFILTVDTEEEWDWGGPFPEPPCSTRNIDELPKFQELCQSIGVCPTYFIDYAVVEVAQHRDTIKHFFDRNECDIGAHLHPWCTPPITEKTSPHTSHAVNIDLNLFRAKMENLTDLLSDAFGTHPYSFRSGRWGINGAMLKVLAELGYGVDSSVRPYHEEPGSFDYNSAQTRPYFPSFSNALLTDHNQRSLLEIPTSSGFNHANFESLNRLQQKLSKEPIRKLRLIGILWKLGLMRKITLTPEDSNANDLKRCIDMCVKRGDGVINIFLHSSNFLPGSTPYVRSGSDLDRMFNSIATCAEHAKEKYNAKFVTVREAGQLLGNGSGFVANQNMSASKIKGPQCVS